MSEHERSARTFAERLVAETYDEAVGGFDATMRAAMPTAALEKTWRTLLGQVGAFQRIESVRCEAAGAHVLVFVTMAFAATQLDLKLAFDPHGAIAGLFFVPSTTPYAPPSYADLARIVEREVVVGKDPWALPGTLSMPANAAPGPGLPAVVLVHGSGPSDRHETIGACRPFRDLALGLATRDIAVLAYDKRTRVHGAKLAKLERFTVMDETIDDAAAAIALLQATPGIDPSRVFVVGHSLGGQLAPRIAQSVPSVRGVAILAGSTRPVPEMMLEQMRYIAGLDPAAASAMATRIEAVEQAAARITELVGGAPPSPGEMVLGAGAAYWIDMADHDALATARAIPQPIFVAHAGRDYQVTAVDFAAWTSALEGCGRATLVTYPTLSHALGVGSGPSRPEEYRVRAEVEVTLVDDLARWIHGVVG